MKSSANLLLALILPVLAGCHTMHKPGFPRQSYDEKKTITQLEKQFPATLIEDYYTQESESEKKALRNKIVDGRLALINLNYNQFVAHFSVTKQSIDAGAEMTELGLNLATTAVGGAAAKTTLAAISAGVTGTKLAVDKNFFFEKTVPVLVGSMNAQRKEVLVPILSGIVKNTDEYPLTQALSDLDAYYFAGTFIGALQSIQAESGAKEKKAEITIAAVRDSQFVDETIQNRVKALLTSISELSDAAATNLALKVMVAAPGSPFEALAKLRDPLNRRFTSGKVAREMLKLHAVLASRKEEDLTTWEAAVKTNL